MRYSVKTLGQLSLFLKEFRKEKKLTQAAMGAKLGITQQSYASFEANAETATFERLFVVLRLLDVEISLDRVVPFTGRYLDAIEAAIQQRSTVADAVMDKKTAPSAIRRTQVVAPTRKKARKRADNHEA